MHCCECDAPFLLDNWSLFNVPLGGILFEICFIRKLLTPFLLLSVPLHSLTECLHGKLLSYTGI